MKNKRKTLRRKQMGGEIKNRLEQKRLLKRFIIDCYGHQETVEEMRAEKAGKFRELREKRGTLEYDEWFLTYRPGDKKQIKQK